MQQKPFTLFPLRFTQLSKPSCVAPSVGLAPPCCSNLWTWSRPACRCCRAACSPGEFVYYAHVTFSFHRTLSLIITWFCLSITRNGRVHLFFLLIDLFLFPLQLRQSGHGVRAPQCGADRETTGTVERRFPGRHASNYNITSIFFFCFTEENVLLNQQIGGRW